MTKTELEAKLAKAKKNSLLPESLRAKIVAKIVAEIKALAPAKVEHPDKDVVINRRNKSDKFMVYSVKTKMPWANEQFKTKAEATEFIKENGLNDVEDKKDLAKKIIKGIKPINQEDVDKSVKEADKEISKVKAKADYDCDDLIEKEKARKAASKKSAKKAESTPVVKKDEKQIVKVVESIKKHYKEGSLTEDAVIKLIKEFSEKLAELKEILKTFKK